MDKNLQDIEDLFKKELENEGEQVPLRVWDNIEHVLDKDNLVSIKKKYSSLKKIAVLLLFVLIGFSIYELMKMPGKNFNESGVAVKAAPLKNETHNIVITEKNGKLKVLRNIERKPGAASAITAAKKKLSLLLNTGKIAAKTGIITQDENDEHSNDLLQLAAVNNNADIDIDGHRQMNLQLHYSEKLNYLSGELKGLADSIKTLNSIALNKIIFSDDLKKSPVKNKKINDKKVLRFSLTPFFSTNFSFYRLQDDEDDNQPENANTLSQRETPDLSSTAGILIGYWLNKKWELQSGITFSNTNITLDPKIIYAQADNNGDVKFRINTSSGYGFILPSFSNSPVVGDSLYVFTSTHNLQYINLPFLIKYNNTKGKFKLNVFAGPSLNFLTRGKIETTVEKDFNNELEVVNNINGLKKVYFSGLTGVGMEYSLTRKFALVFSPTMRFALNSINKHAPVKSYPNSFELAAGIKIGL